MPGNFENHLKIETIEGKKRISPIGSLGEVLGPIARDMVAKAGPPGVALHLWVIQLQDEGMGGGAFMQALGNIPGDADFSWTTREAGIHHHGNFRTGPAFATAVAISDAQHIMEWWSETIRLTDPKDAMGKVAGSASSPNSA